MTDFRDWLQRVHRQRITANDVAESLNISRATATRKLLDGLDASDIITLCRKTHVNPIQALVDLGHLTEDEVYDFLDNGRLMVDTATNGQLSLELARRLNPATMAATLDEIESRSNVVDFQSARPDIPQDAVADSSDYHEEENNEFDD
ncbi:hypothetical protein [Corynebacterium amycolatum]|uniref:hypothetical protein n=1 Tax=Corynebacterium amycolatum TaxID=43765 RepID=UPI00191F4DF1|nr:hypothetical protein [Corynebacterium amycolatum]QQU97756.1 hypothetical protein I6I65_10565 [Corynebacterium amycolatum]